MVSKELSISKISCAGGTVGGKKMNIRRRKAAAMTLSACLSVVLTPIGEPSGGCAPIGC